MCRIMAEKYDQEYSIIFKQYKKHLLHAGEFELNIRSELKETAVQEDINEENTSHKIRNVSSSQLRRELSL